MITITRSDIQRVTLSAFGALLVSTACIGAAIFPAKAAEATYSTAAGWQTAVEKRIRFRQARVSIGSTSVTSMPMVANSCVNRRRVPP